MEFHEYHDQFKTRMEQVTASSVRACTHAAWAQWSALGSMAAGSMRGPAGSIVDPEALILLSLHLTQVEPRFQDLAGWWASTGPQLISVQRLKSIAKRFPDGTAGFHVFAGMAASAGDRRWRRHVLDGAEGGRSSSGSDPSLVQPATLWLRLRAGLGVGAKADILALLLGTPGARLNARKIAHATGYSATAVRTAAHEMAMGRLIRESSSRPVEYVAAPRPWAEILDLYAPPSAEGSPETGLRVEMPRWVHWADAFSFLCHIQALASSTADEGVSERVALSRVKSLVTDHMDAPYLDAIPVPDPSGFGTDDLLNVLEEMTEGVGRWVLRNA